MQKIAFMVFCKKRFHYSSERTAAEVEKAWARCAVFVWDLKHVIPDMSRFLTALLPCSVRMCWWLPQWLKPEQVSWLTIKGTSQTWHVSNWSSCYTGSSLLWHVLSLQMMETAWGVGQLPLTIKTCHEILQMASNSEVRGSIFFWNIWIHLLEYTESQHGRQIW